SRSPHLRSWRDGWRHLRFMLLFSPRWLFLIPGLFLLAVGAVFGGRLWWGPLPIGRVTLDTNVLLVCALLFLVGLQLCLFAVMARIFAGSEGFLPFGDAYVRAFRFSTLERGLAAGLLLAIAGAALLIRAFVKWRATGYGALSYPESLRLVIPSVTFLAAGTQIFFSSFFLSMLGLRRHTSAHGPAVTK